MKPVPLCRVDSLNELQTNLWRDKFSGTLTVYYQEGLIKKVRSKEHARHYIPEKQTANTPRGDYTARATTTLQVEKDNA